MLYTTKRIKNLVIGSGAAGLAAAIRLDAAETAVYTEGLTAGTSINTGSDKQTYYKLGMYGAAGDSVTAMAQDLARNGAMHLDLALAEASLSAAAFGSLVQMGVEFPHDEFGQFIGYKTDHDPCCRATSAGPYTSRDMCRALIAELKRRRIAVYEDRIAVELIVEKSRCCGAVFVNTSPDAETLLEIVYAENTVFAVGGPAGLYRTSVYPGCHTGAIGLALARGARARNLAESQFGLASLKFRWNVSGSFMQVIPRFISTDENGQDAREFLNEYFTVPEQSLLIFLKGYQWPFAAGHLPGSSLIDICVHREIVERKRRVWLDYRSNFAGYDPAVIPEEAREYMRKSNILDLATPFERLASLNMPAVSLYRDHDIDLETEMLEIAVCAQHNNGGLAGDKFWRSENISNLYPVGEVNGSHGITRPGGSALNSGQCGAIRAAESISRGKSAAPVECNYIPQSLLARLEKSPTVDYRAMREKFQSRMSEYGGFLRERSGVEKALQEAFSDWQASRESGLLGLTPHDIAEALRNDQLLCSQCAYLSAISFAVKSGVGSRGGAAVIAADAGKKLHPALDIAIEEEDESFRSKVQITELTGDGFKNYFEDVRPLPGADGWFENVWKAYRSGEIYEK